jgi:ATP-dependent DNA ligase
MFDDPALTKFFGMLQRIEEHRVIRPIKRRAAKVSRGPMLARLYAGETPASYVCEPKVDGLRVLITADLSRRVVRFETRNGNPMPSLDHLADEVLDLLAGKDGVWLLDGEAVSGKSFFTSVGALRSEQSADDACVWLFDLPSVEGDYSTRRASLEALFAQSYPTSLLLIPSVSCTPEEAFLRFTAEGFEGAMVKDTTAPYSHGLRSRAWLKVKDADTTDAEIVDVVEGAGKCSGMAGHIVVRCGRRLVNVGTGMDNATRVALLADKASIIGRTAEVVYQMKTPKGSLRHPVFVGVRGDK